MKMKILFKIPIFLLLAANSLAQSPNTPPILFSSRFQITNAVNGTGDTIVISGYTDDCTTRFSNSDITIGDSLYVLEGTDLLIFGVVTTRTISLGIATFKVRDFNGAGLLPSNGQAAIFRPTTDYDFPGYVCGLNDGLQQYISDRFRQNLDAALSAGSTDSTIYATVYSRDTAAAAIRGEIAALAQPPFDSTDIATGGIGNTDLAAAIVSWSKLAQPVKDSINLASVNLYRQDGTAFVSGDTLINSKTRKTTNYTIALTDAGNLVEMDSTDANTVTVPPNSSAAFSINSHVTITQYGAGQTSIIAGVGVTIRSSAGNLAVPSRYSPVVLKKIAADEWYLWNGAPVSASITGEALTKVDDTNVTLTLGGSPTDALVNAASITAGWTGQLAASRGGTGSNLGAWLLGGGYTLSSQNDVSMGGFNVNFLNGNTLFGPTGATITANTRMDIRGTGTTINLLSRWADSANTLRMSLTDAGNLSVPTGSVTSYAFGGFAMTSSGWSVVQVNSLGPATAAGIRYSSAAYRYPHFMTSATMGNSGADYEGMTIYNLYNKNNANGTYTGLNIIPDLSGSGAFTHTMSGITYNPTITVVPAIHYGIRIIPDVNNGFGTATPTATVDIEQDTLGTKVIEYSTTATNDDPTNSIYQNRIATTNTTLTTLHTLAIPATTTVLAHGFVVARRTGGTSGAAEDGAAYEFKAVYKNVAGTATLIGSSTINVIGEDQAAWDFQLNASSGNVLIQVQGAADNNVTWHLSQLNVMPVTQ